MTADSALRTSSRRLLPTLAAFFLLLSGLMGGARSLVHGIAAGHLADQEPRDRCVTGAIAHGDTHLESCGEPEQAACPGCLHHRTLRGLYLPRVTALLADPEGSRLPVAASDRLPSAPCSDWVGGRSPPFA